MTRELVSEQGILQTSWLMSAIFLKMCLDQTSCHFFFSITYLVFILQNY